MQVPLLLKPIETTAAAILIGERKTQLPIGRMLILSFLAGAYIAFAAQASNMGAYNLLSMPETFGLGRTVAGLIFGSGLVFVVLTGCELFTGNVLITASLAANEVTAARMLRNWFWVYVGNFLGSIFIAWSLCQSGLWGSSGHLLGAMTLKIALGKISLSFGSALVLGFLCNWLVCLAVWLSFSTMSMQAKIMGIFLPIFMFVLSGFEHSVANMYYIPAGIMAAQDPAIVAKALAIGVSPEGVASLTWGNFVMKNLIPVTLGNMIGGILFIAMAYFYGHGKPSKEMLESVKESIFK